MVLYKPNQVEADNIKKIRTENDLTHDQFAKIINVELSKSSAPAAIKARTIQNYESGLYSIPMNVRKAINDRFNIEIQEAPPPAPLRDIFKERLVLARKRRGLEMEKLASLSGCLQYRRYESGKNIPKLEHYVRICGALGASSDYLLGLEETMDGRPKMIEPPYGDEKSGAKSSREKILEVFPANLRAAREKKEMIPNNAAKITGCPEYPKYEKGESLPSLETLYKIWKSLRVSSDYLLGMQEEMEIRP